MVRARATATANLALVVEEEEAAVHRKVERLVGRDREKGEAACGCVWEGGVRVVGGGEGCKVLFFDVVCGSLKANVEELSRLAILSGLVFLSSLPRLGCGIEISFSDFFVSISGSGVGHC